MTDISTSIKESKKIITEGEHGVSISHEDHFYTDETPFRIAMSHGSFLGNNLSCNLKQLLHLREVIDEFIAVYWKEVGAKEAKTEEKNDV